MRSGFEAAQEAASHFARLRVDEHAPIPAYFLEQLQHGLPQPVVVPSHSAVEHQSGTRAVILASTTTTLADVASTLRLPPLLPLVQLRPPPSSYARECG